MSYVLAVDLGGTKCSAAVVDRKGRIVSRRTVTVDLSSQSAPVQQIVQLARELAQGANSKLRFAAAGIAVPGLVRRNGTVWAPNLPGWERVPLASRLKKSFQIPVVVESDRNAAVLGECWQGAARGKSDVIVLMIGTGIGAGIMSGGSVIRGAHELSGCAGWLTISLEGNPDSSAIGEMESLAAGPGIANSARKRLGDGVASSLAQFDVSKITAHEVAAAAREGDRMALDIFHRAGKLLGFGIANIISLFDPEVVIIGGGMAAAADLYLDSARDAILERAQPLAARQVKLAVSKLRDSANLLGCARLAWQSLETQKSNKERR
ncbi:MAG TPA: ROK family protein [Candidatus Acidoferrales bacterium]|nr:ROK family protein [Candidatus Acidoferrales bacterium]